MTRHRATLFCASAAGGIHRVRIGPTGEALAPAERVSDGPAHAFFLAAHPRLPLLYAADVAAGAVEAYAADPAGPLSRVARLEFPGTGPCHLALDPAGRFLLVAEYRGGVRLLPLGPRGIPQAPGSLVRLPPGSGASARQAASHPHGVAPGPGGLVYACDLGGDRVCALRVAADGATLTLADEAAAAVTRGAGPRHLAFSPSGAMAVVVNELGNTLRSYAVDPESGRLRARNTRPLLPPDFAGESWAAEAAFHPSGRACYASNRGHDSLVRFEVDPASGRLGAPEWLAARGARPTHFAFDPAGTRLWVANENSDAVAAWAVDPASGAPAALLEPIPCPRPTCVLLRSGL